MFPVRLVLYIPTTQRRTIIDHPLSATLEVLVMIQPTNKTVLVVIVRHRTEVAKAGEVVEVRVEVIAVTREMWCGAAAV